jgi:hypothetical protein
MSITRGSGSVRDSLVGLIVPGLLMTALVGVIVVKWHPALATEPAPLPPGTLSALHREAVRENGGEGHDAFLRIASKGRVGDPGGLSTARDDLSRALSGLEGRLGEHPSDTAAAARLADVLPRQSPVLNNPGLAVRAEDVLRAALEEVPDRCARARGAGRSILYHAAAIHRAAGDMATARILIGKAVDGHPEFDPIEGPAAATLAKALNTSSASSASSTTNTTSTK